MDWDLFDESLRTLAESVGDDLREFMGSHAERRVSEAGVREAARTLASLYTGMPDPPERIVASALREGKARAFEAVWFLNLRWTTTDPARRVALTRFIEERTGRSLPIETEERYLAEAN